MKKLTNSTFYVLILTILGFSIQAKELNEYKLSLDFKETKIKLVLDEIKNQTELKFVYSNSDFKDQKKVTIQVQNQELDKILEELTKDQPVDFNLKGTEIYFTKISRKITGVVNDEAGESLAGVSVISKYSQAGTVTDIDGKFDIYIKKRETGLEFSFMGMTKQLVELGAQTNISVVLKEESVGIDEVVVVGYGTQKKINLTAAVEQVSAEILENRPVQSVSQGLQGAVAGLNVKVTGGAPNQNPSLNIRGFTGFDDRKSPLILVDGVEMNVNDINPNDVESYTFLKDAAASAIYGSRAPYGVILITTKMGKKGEKIKVKFSNNVSFASPLKMPEFLDSWENARKRNSGYYNLQKNYRYSPENIQKMLDYAAGKITESNGQTNGKWDRKNKTYANTDWTDLTIRDNVPSMQSNLSFSGGSDNTSYYMGIGYNNKQGLFKGAGDYYDRYNALLKARTSATDWLDLHLSINYSRTDEEGPNYSGKGRDYGSMFHQIYKTFPNWPAYEPNGEHHLFSPLPSLNGDGGMDSKQRNTTVISGGIVIEPIDNLVFDGKYTWKNYNDHWTRSSFPIYTTHPNGAKEVSKRTSKISKIQRDMYTKGYHTVDLNASYKFSFWGHNIKMLAGYQHELSENIKLKASRTDTYSKNTPVLNATYGENIVADDELGNWSTRGFYGRFTYDYKSRYLFQFNGRYDAHSKFPEEIRWAFFPSYSFAWNIAEEGFWKVKEVDMLKIRGSYASLGDNGSDNYLYLPTMGLGQDSKLLLGGTTTSYVTLPPIVSDELTWAKPKTLGIGLEVSALKNRLELKYDWYQRTIYDQAGPAKLVPETLGTNAPKVNNSITETRGWEFSIRWRDKAGVFLGEDINYHVRAHISDYIGYVVEYSDNVNGTRGGTWTPGEVFGKQYVYESNGIAQNYNDLTNSAPQGGSWYYPGDLMLKDINGDGQVNSGDGGYWYAEGDRVDAGFNYPKYTYGIDLGVDWNGLNLSILLDGVGQWDKYTTSSYAHGSSYNVWDAVWYKQHEDLGSWSLNNTGAFYPRYYVNNKNVSRANEQFLLDLSYLRVKNITLGYTLPQLIINYLPFEKMYIYSSIENLGYIHYGSFIDFHPEVLGNTNGNVYPNQRIISFGLNITM